MRRLGGKGLQMVFSLVFIYSYIGFTNSKGDRYFQYSRRHYEGMRSRRYARISSVRFIRVACRGCLKQFPIRRSVLQTVLFCIIICIEYSTDETVAIQQ